MGGQGKPNGTPQEANGHGPIGGHAQSLNNDFKVEIEHQMGAELADLMEQQAQENEYLVTLFFYLFICKRLCNILIDA